MLASFPDPAPEYGKWHAVEVVKAGPPVEIRVEGTRLLRLSGARMLRRRHR